MATDPGGTVYTRMLQRAVEVAGTHERLAEALDVTTAEVRRWHAGEAPPPKEAVFVIEDIIASGTLIPAYLAKMKPRHSKRRRPSE